MKHILSPLEMLLCNILNRNHEDVYISWSNESTMRKLPRFAAVRLARWLVHAVSHLGEAGSIPVPGCPGENPSH